ncbi:MAG: hypothetical protein HY800_04495 [Ignavibacteriales bacterium]|nr:hypothetical protein [Ignavibacteriales bacterium]
MQPYYNLPVIQRTIQCLVEKFNADEMLWHSLQHTRKLRRKTLKQLTPKQHQALDLLEFSALRPQDDYIGVPLYQGM